MIWTLYKKSAKATLRSTVAALMSSEAERTRQQMCVVQIERIVRCLKQANNLHPAWLTQQYGSVDGYLEHHLSTSDWGYVLQLRQVTLVNELAGPTCSDTVRKGVLFTDPAV